MDTIDFKQIWQQRQPETPDIKAVLAKASDFRKTLRRKTIGANVLLLATMAFVIWVVIYFDPQMWTTKIGALLTVMAIVIFILFSGKMLFVSKLSNEPEDAKHALETLRKIQQNQSVIHTKIMNVYFLLLSAGIFLYMIEYAMRMPMFMAICVYVITAAWFAINWFYIRKKAISKQREKIDAVISSLEKIEKQFES